MMNKKEALEYVGGFSSPSKMPCYGYSIPAKYCKVGSILRKVEGTSCSKCYARKGRYVFPKVQNALDRRYKTLTKEKWVDAMIIAINEVQKFGEFRWHDSGDLTSVQHLINIVKVCEGTPTIKHWLPTREYQIVSDFVNGGGKIPDNLIIRLSAVKIDGNAPTELAKRLGVYTSTIDSGKTFNCLASLQKGKCLDCRRCWNKDVFNISYKKH